jgi:hypothetical protein
VQEVDVLPVDGGGELGELVELTLVLAPVVRRTPVLGQLLQIVQRDTTFPADAGYLARPPGAGQPLGQVVQVSLGDVNPEGPDLVEAFGVGHSGSSL